ncbi:MAG: GNAT family N-acetyltransferase [Parvularculaceae bacterium]
MNNGNAAGSGTSLDSTIAYDQAMMKPAPIKHVHYPALIRLNAAVVEKTAPMDADDLASFVNGAVYARQVNDGEAMLLVLDQAADFYDSEHFAFFAARHKSFYYIDRIIVAPSLHGTGVGRALYEDLFGWVAAAGGGIIGCEVNTTPPNPVSHAFHRTLGFKPCGTGSRELPDGGTKQVTYYEITV